MPRRFVEIEDDYDYRGYSPYRARYGRPSALRQAGGMLMSMIGLISGFLAVFFAFVVLMPDHEISQKVVQNLPEQVSSSIPTFPIKWNWFEELTTTPAPTTTTAPTTEAPPPPTTEAPKSYRPQFGLAGSLAITFGIITAITAIDSILTRKYPDEGTKRYMHGTMGSAEEHGVMTVTLSIILYVLVLLGVTLINHQGYLFGIALLVFVGSAVWVFDRTINADEADGTLLRAREFFFTMARTILVLLVLNGLATLLFSTVYYAFQIVITLVLLVVAYLLFDKLAMKSYGLTSIRTRLEELRSSDD